MSSMQRQELILKKMKERGIEVGSGITNKKYDSKEIYELIHIRKKLKKQLPFFIGFKLLTFTGFLTYSMNR